jgi:hypothetical protein
MKSQVLYNSGMNVTNLKKRIVLRRNYETLKVCID